MFIFQLKKLYIVFLFIWIGMSLLERPHLRKGIKILYNRNLIVFQ